MSSFENNKIFGAALAAVLCAVAAGQIAKEVMHAPAPEKRGFSVEVPEQAAAGAIPKKVGPEPIAEFLKVADAEAGMKVFKKCAACHTLDEGGANKVGPNLWNIIDADIAGNPGFAYSAVLQGLEGNWTYEELNKFLYKPAKYAKGTKMSFIGLKKAKDRANLIAYLESLQP